MGNKGGLTKHLASGFKQKSGSSLKAHRPKNLMLRGNNCQEMGLTHRSQANSRRNLFQQNKRRQPPREPNMTYDEAQDFLKNRLRKG